ncbi:MAG: hypothetical protein AB7V46_11605 [Thermomicrobiales bacterium]
MPSSRVATLLDWNFLEVERRVTIAGSLDVGPEIQPRQGTLIAEELAGRKLLRYLTPDQVGLFLAGTNRLTYVTPTPYAPEEMISWLFLPSPRIARTHVLLLDPAKIPLIQGPMWVAAGSGIQYVLPHGFPADAIIVPGAGAEARWELEVR